MLCYGYFSNLNTGPKLLIWGGPDDMARLYEALSLAGEGEGPESLADITGSRSVDGSSVLFETVGDPEGIVRDEVEPDIYHWRMDTQGWFDFQSLVEPLTHRNGRGHQYLESRAGEDIVVMVSCDEYPADLMP
jgi:hypothetical protein